MSRTLRRLAPVQAIAISLALAAVALASSGCEDDAFCFSDCDKSTGTSTHSGGGGTGGENTGGCLFNCTGSGGNGGEAGGGTCIPVSNEDSVCDGKDDDCDGDIDEDVDFGAITHCGTCDNNCFTQLLNVDPTTIACDWDGTEGQPGTCSFVDCASDYYDLDQDGLSCEYYCINTASDDTLCNNTDDDCDGETDEDVDLCSDALNCGVCNRQCEVVHGTGGCVDDGQLPCNDGNTHCEIVACDDDDNDGHPDWWDKDGSFATGCEFSCSLTDGGAGLGVETCGDGIDNDCDGLIDGADDLSGDTQIGVVCYGDPDGICALPANAGATACIGGQVVCDGPNVKRENDVAETCNLVDDDCDGVVDDSPTDAGSSCGQSAVFPCQLGTEQCQNGALVCVGAINPQTELCNGIDDDCNGTLDDNTSDSGGQCNVPIPPPPNATSPCLPGTLECQGGVLVCTGSVGPSSVNDGCGDDSNCDGQLTGQPDTTSDVSNCGGCGNDCYSGAQHELWSCQASTCVYGGCQPGWHDLNNDQICEYGPCIASGPELCDGIDNDCDGTPDNNLTVPSPKQVCGVSPAASRPECTTNVAVACVSGNWECTFPAGVCSPTCAGATEICDALDNDCDGGFNENVPNFGLSCTSSGYGACVTTGNYVCDTPTTTICDAVPNDCAPNCDELCDGIDNDCDGMVDEPYTDKGANPTYFVKPAVTRIGASLWTFSYEASRPDASATSAGSGNGYHCGTGCSPLPNAPPNTVLDSTIACSVPTVLPWFNVSPVEVEQTCDAIGGFICDTPEWQTACEATIPCDWGYAPRGGACTSFQNPPTKQCNLSLFDFDTGTAGDQDGLLVTGSPLLGNCWADWDGLLGNTAATGKIFDITGNLREITRRPPPALNEYPLLGGSSASSQVGATCQFDFYVVQQSFKLLDTGFRCCFDSDPRL